MFANLFWMITKLLTYIKNSLDNGFKLPLAHDPNTKQGSVTLMFPYISFFLALFATYKLVRNNELQGAIAATTLWLLSTVLYLLRNLTKVKLDLDDKNIELDGGNDDKTASNS